MFHWLQNSFEHIHPDDSTEPSPLANGMKKNEIIDRSRKFAEPYCVTNGKNFRLKDIDPGATDGAASEDKSRAKELLEFVKEKLIANDEAPKIRLIR